ncbi:MAG TPA: hypothetical protein VIM62_05365 [Acidobacteriaceae bacterium]
MPQAVITVPTIVITATTVTPSLSWRAISGGLAHPKNTVREREQPQSMAPKRKC